MLSSKDSPAPQKRDAEHSFIFGEQSLRAYLAGGNVHFLQDAEASFDAIGPSEQRYDVARFYLGVTKTQLRKTAESIPILEDLQKRKSGELGSSPSDLGNKIALQLAYAHIKTYTDSGFAAAEAQLKELEKTAKQQGDAPLLTQSQAIQVFLYSVMAGYSGQKERRPDFAGKSLNLGEELLNTAPFAPEVKFEALNAMGIAWMRIGEGGWDNQSRNRAECWDKAQWYYDEALRIIPNSVRVLENLATLRMIQVTKDLKLDVPPLLLEAKDYCLRSLAVNDQDQFPYLQLARIAAAQGDAKTAIDAARTGRTRPGVVTEDKWKRVEEVAEYFARKTTRTRFSREAFKPNDAAARLILSYLEGDPTNWKQGL
jgi:tetratricopeptide (TPR) repeat protein